MRPVILVSGFEPFNQANLNPSGAVLELLSCDAAELRTVLLPVEYERAAAVLLAEIAAVGPAAVVSLGQAEGRSAITVERVAVNIRGAAIADNGGRLISDEPVAEDADPAHFTALPWREMVEAMRAAGVSAAPSFTAGTFICNEVFYSVRNAHPGLPAGFIHLPLMDEQSADFAGLATMPLVEQARALNAALAALAQML